MTNKDLDLYYEVSDKFNTNLREVFDCLCTGYHQRDDSYRFKKLQGIAKAEYDFHALLEGYKIHYVENVGKPYVIDEISNSIILLLKYGVAIFQLTHFSTSDLDQLQFAVKGNYIPESAIIDQLKLFIDLANNIDMLTKQISTHLEIIDQYNNLTNPWEQIKNKGPFILNADKKIIEQFNKRVSEDYLFIEDLPPEPYIGNPHTADIFLLALNPGYDGGEQKYLNEVPDLQKALIKNLKHQNDKYPLFFLDEQFRESPGFKWWERILKPVLANTNDDYLLLSNKICELQFFPYHSRKYKPLGHDIEAQQYTFGLLKNAIVNKKMIIILRSEKLWVKAVPELLGNYARLNSYQNVVISEKNLGKERFEHLISLIKR